VTPRPAFALILLCGRAVLASETPAASAPAAELTGWKVVPAPAVFHRIAFGSGRFVAVDESSRVYASTDAVRWDPVKMPDHRTQEWLFHQTGAFIGVGSPSSGFSMAPELPLAVSQDGLDWKGSTVKVETRSQFHPAFHAHGNYLVVGSLGTILTSPDASSWTLAKRVTLNQLEAVAFGAGVFVAVGWQGTILTSPDGAHWTPRSSGVTDKLSSIVRVGGQFYVTTQIVGQNQGGVLLTSPDGIHWTRRRCPAGAESLYAAAAGNGRLVAVGGDKKGKVLLSSTLKAIAEDTPASQDELVGILGSNIGGPLSTVRISNTGTATWSKPITPQNRDLRAFPTVREQAVKAEDFAPDGWKLQSAATGDLNGDGQDDLALILREDELTVSVHPTSDGPVQRQILALAFRDPANQQFRRVQQDTSLWPPFDQWGSYKGEPSISIAKGGLLMTFEGGLQYGRDFGSHHIALKAIYRFRYQQDAFRLIGAEPDATKDLDGYPRHLSVNMLNGKKISNVSKNKRDAQTETFAKPTILPALGPELRWRWCMTLPEPELAPFTPPFFTDEM
jgi:hypothetical protein